MKTPKTFNDLLAIITQSFGIKNLSAVEACNKLCRLKYFSPLRLFISKVKSLTKIAFEKKINISRLTLKFALDAVKKVNLNIYTSILHLSTNVDEFIQLIELNSSLERPWNYNDKHLDNVNKRFEMRFNKANKQLGNKNNHDRKLNNVNKFDALKEYVNCNMI
ncbi:hypothetical protein A3Q56_07909 [Intoshia linei]|uniref:Uncharacterized protein n=1 Tax=Intoshia linei TaxID=1819745 RepID=A0A177ARF1_9BILA|nr:hypothetical protein A3Q56_07909 [Intoshia linei]